MVNWNVWGRRVYKAYLTPPHFQLSREVPSEPKKYSRKVSSFAVYWRIRLEGKD